LQSAAVTGGANGITTDIKKTAAETSAVFFAYPKNLYA
jgi:hypothetical protein